MFGRNKEEEPQVGGRYNSSGSYITSEALRTSINSAIAVEKPLIIKGEPGTGKTVLAREIADSLGLRLISWHVKSTSKAQHGLYQVDQTARLVDGNMIGVLAAAKDVLAAEEGAEEIDVVALAQQVKDVRNYIQRGPVWEAFASEEQVVLLIDEVDKAEIEFPNDLLRELDEMAFLCRETDETIAAEHRPIIIITSNDERELPDAFRRRCLFHYIDFPDRDLLRQIVEVHHPGIEKKILEEALAVFEGLRATPGIKKKPSTSELIDWLGVILSDELGPSMRKQLLDRAHEKIPGLGALVKDDKDRDTVLAILSQQGLDSLKKQVEEIESRRR